MSVENRTQGVQPVVHKRSTPLQVSSIDMKMLLVIQFLKPPATLQILSSFSIVQVSR